ncbi:MAG: hypothetical protein JW923_01540 [Spirochaetales bacterium]|nr:hypothetical protein [Spirochaetales bacterium]
MKHRLAAGLLAFYLLLSSCVGVDATARIAANGSVSLDLAYTVSLAADELGRNGDNAAYLPLPTERAGFQASVESSGGRVDAWAKNDGTDRFVVTAKLFFPTLESFVAFMESAGTRPSLSREGGRTALSMELGTSQPPRNADLAAFVTEVFSDYSVSLTLALPATPQNVVGAAVSDRNVRFVMQSSSIYLSEQPVLVSVRW